jgi:hypothetical protein
VMQVAGISSRSSEAAAVGGIFHCSPRYQSGSPTKIVMSIKGFHCDRRGQNDDDLHQRSTVGKETVA